MSNKVLIALFFGLFCFSPLSKAGIIGFADLVLDYQYTVFNNSNSLTCAPNEGVGGLFPRPVGQSQFEECMSLDVVLGDDPDSPTASSPADYLSLPSGSSIVVGFLDENIIDGNGFDIFIQEVGSAQEFADVYVSSMLSIDPNDFVFLGQADGDQINSFDLSNIGFTEQVKAVRIVSRSNGGFPVATGFDLANVQALQFVEVPEPKTTILIAVSLFMLGLRRIASY